MGNLLSKPDPVTIVKGDPDYNLEAITIDRVVKFVSNLLENIKEFRELANGKKKKQSEMAQLAGTVGGDASKALSAVSSPCAAVARALIFPAVALYQNMSETKIQIEAIQKLWHINDSPTNQTKFLEDVILAATKIFLSFEIPCNLFGSQYMDLVAQDAVHRIFNYLGSKYKGKYDPDWILKGVMLGKSAREGILAKFRLASAGFQLQKYNTARIFTSPGIVSQQNPWTILKVPEKYAYGYRLILPREPEPLITQTNTPNRSKLPTIVDWDDASTEELIKEICIKVKGKIRGITQKLKLYFEEVSGKLESILGVCMETRDYIVKHSETIPDLGQGYPKPVWSIEYPVASFTGRKDELVKLHELLKRSNGTATVINQICAVYGMGGVGKTEFVKAFALRHSADYEKNGIWIDASTQGSFRNSLVQLLDKKLHISEENSQKKTDTELLEIIYDWSSSRKCLIIFNNVEDFDVIKLLPKARSPNSQIPTVLITSRNARWQQGVKVFHLDVLSIPEAVDLVTKNVIVTPKISHQNVLNLVKTLDRLPLALQQAVAYIRNELCEKTKPIQEYLLPCESPKIKDLLKYKDEGLSEHDKITLTIWNVTMEKIQTKKCGLLAIRIMNIISCFDPDNIPTRIFQQLKSNPVIDNRSITSINNDVEGAIALLKKYSMASGQPGLINVSRLVQRVVRINIDNQIKPVLREARELLDKFMDSDSDRKNDQLVKSLLPHAQSVWRHSMRHNDSLKFNPFFPCAVCDTLNFYAGHSTLRQLGKEPISVCAALLGENHIICVQFNKAKTLYLQADYKGSLVILKEIHSICEAERGREKLTLHISILIAENLDCQGKHGEAKEIRSTIIRSKEFDSSSECILFAIRTNKAHMLLERGQLDESLKLYQSIYEDLQRDLGEEFHYGHIQALRARAQIAQVLACKGMLEESIGQFSIVKEALTHLHMEEHPLAQQTTKLLRQCQAQLAMKTEVEPKAAFELELTDNSLQVL